VRPVRFSDAVDRLLMEHDNLILLEVGPAQVLTQLRRHPAVRAGRVTLASSLPATVDQAAADRTEMLVAAARLWTMGRNLDWEALGQREPSVRIDLPGYPYQRERYWIDSVAMSVAPAGPASPAAEAAEHGAASPFTIVTWTQISPGLAAERASGTALVLLPGQEADALRVIRALSMSGLTTIRVRPGDAYAAGEEYTVRPDMPGDIDKVLADLAERGVAPDVVVHATAATA